MSTTRSGETGRNELPQNAALCGTQLTAIDGIVSGKSITAAAHAAGIDRGTLHRWLRDDPTFRAVYHERRADLVASAQGRLLTIVEKATATAEQAIGAGNVGGADVAQTMGLLAPARVEPDDANYHRRARLVEQHNTDTRHAWIDAYDDDDNESSADGESPSGWRPHVRWIWSLAAGPPL